MQTSKNTSSTSDSAGEELNGSESRTIGNVNDFNAKVNMRGKYYLDNNLKHHISFGGNLGYDGTRGNSEENRDAENAADNSRNDWYSRYATDRSISLRQTVRASYRIKLGENKYFDTGFGIGVYEDNTAHYSMAYGMEENSNAFWQVNAGPDLHLTLIHEGWTYALRSQGRSIAVPQGDAVSTLLDVSNPTDVSTGNIYLKPGYHQDLILTVNYGRRNYSRSYMMLRLTGSMDMNEVTP